MSGLILAGGIFIRRVGSETVVKRQLIGGRNVANSAVVLLKNVIGSFKYCLFVCFGDTSRPPPPSRPWPPHSRGF